MMDISNTTATTSETVRAAVTLDFIILVCGAAGTPSTNGRGHLPLHLHSLETLHPTRNIPPHTYSHYIYITNNVRKSAGGQVPRVWLRRRHGISNRVSSIREVFTPESLCEANGFRQCPLEDALAKSSDLREMLL